MRTPRIPGRDERQKTFGCFGFSMMAHVALLILLTLVASKPKEIAGLAQGTKDGGADAMIMDLAPSTLGSQAMAEDSAAPAKPLLADANDASAVEMAKAAAPKKSAPPKAPAKIAAVKVKAAAIVAREDGDTEIKAALKKAREEEEAKKAALAEEEEKQTPEKTAEKTPEKTVEQTVKPVAIATMAEEPQPQEEQSSDQEEIQAPVVAPVAVKEPVAQPKPQVQAQQPAPKPVAAPVASRVANGTGTSQTSQNTKPQVMPSSTTTAPAATGPGGNGTAQASGRGTSGAGAPVGLINADLLKEKNGPRPPYPDQDRLLNRTGAVVVRATVLSDGSVSNVRLAQSSGSSQMDAAAVNTYYRWKYFPGQAGEVIKKFYFRLDGNTETRYARLRHK